jgi:hypothetical protein
MFVFKPCQCKAKQIGEFYAYVHKRALVNVPREQRTLVNVPENARRQKRTLVNVPESLSLWPIFFPCVKDKLGFPYKWRSGNLY